MHEHPIAAHWGRADLASSDMMSLETSRTVWQARADPRRRTASIGMYTHVLDRWGIFYDQPIVLNERQAGAAIEGVVRQNTTKDIAQIAMDTHGYTDLAMGLARVLGFDLCPRLAHLRDRRLHVPRSYEVPPQFAAITDCDVKLPTIADVAVESLGGGRPRIGRARLSRGVAAGFGRRTRRGGADRRAGARLERAAEDERDRNRADDRRMRAGSRHRYRLRPSCTRVAEAHCDDLRGTSPSHCGIESPYRSISIGDGRSAPPVRAALDAIDYVHTIL
jgi:hypothetical protein